MLNPKHIQSVTASREPCWFIQTETQSLARCSFTNSVMLECTGVLFEIAQRSFAGKCDWRKPVSASAASPVSEVIALSVFPGTFSLIGLFMSAKLEAVSSRSESHATSLLLRAFRASACRLRMTTVWILLRLPAERARSTPVSSLLVANAGSHLLCHRASCPVLDPLREVLHSVLWEAKFLLHSRRNLTNPSAFLTQYLACSRGADDPCATGCDTNLITFVAVVSQSPSQKKSFQLCVGNAITCSSC